MTLKILLGTCVRISELVQAKWEHLDFSRNTWFIPAENAKNKKAFVVPLTDLTASWFASLKELAFASSFVLPLRERHFGREDDAHMEPTTMNAALNRLATLLEGRCRRFTPHDLRSTARSHLGQLGVPLQIAERCLNHSLGDLPAIYDKHDYLEERRNALQLWSTKLANLEEKAGKKVVLLGKAA
ncbi:MAG: Prophage integrase IntA [Nitrosomonadaceae bacterium]|nr:Prophage integrase IntA [Nitrosomonadaceae bacterium]